MSTTYSTTFLVPNLHCPTCVEHITSLMQELHPPATLQSISTVDHVLTIVHDRDMPATSIADVLSLVGYEIYDIILDPRSGEQLYLSCRRDDILFDDAVEKWRPGRYNQINSLDEDKRSKHDSYCQMCAAHTAASKADKQPPQSFVAIDAGATSATARHVADFSIGGMTCSSCVGNVVEALQSVTGVDQADVSLISHSAKVGFSSSDPEGLANRLKQAVEDVGYDIELVHLDLVENAEVVSSESAGTRTICLRIDGMHCSHCPERIYNSLQELDVEIVSSVTLDSPTLSLSYTPASPLLTIRSIIDRIKAIDGAFVVSINKPASIEDRSKRMLVRERKMILLRALLALLAAIPTLIIGIIYMDLVSKQSHDYKFLMQTLGGVPRAEWAVFLMATVVYFFATDYFHRRTIKELRALWRPRSQVPISRRFYRFGSMNMLISLGTTIAYFSSLAELLVAATSPKEEPNTGYKGSSYFDSVVFLTMFLLFGRLAEAHMKAKSGDAVSALGKLRPNDALLIDRREQGENLQRTSRVNVDLIDVGDHIMVPLGSSPPCDGVLLDETADFNESSLTGEARVVRKQAGDPIYSGTINRGQVVTMRVTAPPGSSTLDSIIQIVREGNGKRAPVERVADMLTAYFVPVIVAVAILTWIIWLSLGTSGALPATWLGSTSGRWLVWSLQFAIAVFVIACPCGLGLAAPTALFVGSGLAARRGILVKGGGEAFQEAANLDAVVFDKTGTLTQGSNPVVVEHKVYGDEKDICLSMLKLAEESSSHPLAKAIVNFCNSKRLESLIVLRVDEIAGKGLNAEFETRNPQDRYETLIGNEALVHASGITIPRETAALLGVWKSSGHSIIIQAIRHASAPWVLGGIFAAADPIRSEAGEVVKSLQSNGIDVWMLSGDNECTAKAVGSQVGIPPTNIIAGVLPAEKADKIRFLQRSLKPRGGKGFLALAARRRSQACVAMVGDGVNDAPALATADVGIAVASGSDVALQSAAFVLMKSDLHAVLTLITLSRVVFRRVLLNFFWAAIYNVVAVPLAAGVLYPITTSRGTHVRLDPAWAALAMALSSISVVASSLLLRTRLPLIGFRENS